MSFIKKIPKVSPLAFILEPILYFLILFSPSFYGGVTLVPVTVIELFGLLLFFVYSTKIYSKDGIALANSTVWPAFLFISIIFIQLIKIPYNICQFISPSTAVIYNKFVSYPLDWVSLSIYPEGSIYLILQVVICFAVYLTIASYVDSESKGKRIIFAIICSGLIFSLIAFFSGSYSPGSLFSTFTNPNHFAAYVQAIIFLALGYAVASSNNIARFITLFLISVMSVALFYSQSRAGRICFIFGILFFFVLIKVKNRKLSFSPWLLVPVLFSLIFLAVIGTNPLFKRLETLSNFFGEYHGRFVMALDSFRIFMDFPLFGTGLGTFGEIVQKYKSLSWFSRYGFSHNEPVQLLSETGIVGSSLIILFILLNLKKALKTFLERNNRFVVYTSIGGITGIVTVCIQSFFDFIFHVPSILMLFFIILGLLYGLANIRHSQERPKGISVLTLASFYGPVFAAGCLIFVTITGGVIISRYRAEKTLKAVESENRSVDGIEAVLYYNKLIRKINSAISLNSYNSRYYSKKGDLFIKLAAVHYPQEGLIHIKQPINSGELLDNALVEFSKSIELNPTNADYHFKLGWVYDKLGKESLALAAFDKAMSLDPMNNTLLRVIHEYIHRPRY